jgi:hypothetical protein
MRNCHNPLIPRGLKIAFAFNFLWINLSETLRYLLVVRPMLLEAFPEDPKVAPVDWPTLMIWGLWDLLLIIAATGFYWLWLQRFGAGISQILSGSLALSLTLFGLLWLGIANMGLAPIDLLWVALPLAWIEQAIACAIVAWALRRANYSPSSIRSM